MDTSTTEIKSTVQNCFNDINNKKQQMTTGKALFAELMYTGPRVNRHKCTFILDSNLKTYKRKTCVIYILSELHCSVHRLNNKNIKAMHTFR